MKALICEDDHLIRKGLSTVLQSEGYGTLEAGCAASAIELFGAHRPQFVCLDIMLPGRSGYDVCRAIREVDERVPIIFISAKGEEGDRVLGFELGADDYIVKPFGVREIVSRIRAVTRRCFRVYSDRVSELDFGGIRVVPDELCCFKGETRVEISLRDSLILQLLHRERGRVVTRERLLDECWGMRYISQSRTLDQHISKLRRKLGQPASLDYPIETVHGVGYRHPKNAGTKD